MRSDYALIYNDLMHGNVFQAEQKLQVYAKNYPPALTSEDVSKVTNYISFLSKKSFILTALNFDLLDSIKEELSVQLTSARGTKTYAYGMTQSIEEHCADYVKIKIIKKDDTLMSASISFEDVKKGLEKSFSQPLQQKNLKVDTAVLFKTTTESTAGTATFSIGFEIDLFLKNPANYKIFN